MSIVVTPHLNFRGSARAALERYAAAFGGEVAIATHAQAYGTEGVEADLVAFGVVTAPSGFRVMAFDVPAARPYDPGTIPMFVSVRSTDLAELTTAWERLADGSTIVVPFGPAAWSPAYGMLQDAFGVTWVLDIEVARD
ncbi:VOC family protein [Agrococcus sp. SGAir0287]|uniref:VOC family protein n=1 Tax=Agrococcus sp. SGAir0287 TaxID=2070347 RepID=UPI0010CD4673|nr:VOC family protein [Agrococcus sp. SGAir0287]QCR18428.1 bleomycin resistance protein [Agrococcus sp. SGAir0287]